MSHSHQCQRCLKLVSASGVHTCTPTKLVRDLEQRAESAEAEYLEQARLNGMEKMRTIYQKGYLTHTA